MMLWIFIYIFLSETTCGLTNSDTAMFGKNIRHIEFRTVYGISYTDCLRACKLRPRCQSIDYFRKHMVCDLNRKSPLSIHMYMLETFPGVVHTLIGMDQVKCGDSVCTETQTCDVKTASCVFKECKQFEETWSMITVGNMNQIGAKVMLKCANKRQTLQTQCQPNGKWETEEIEC